MSSSHGDKIYKLITCPACGGEFRKTAIGGLFIKCPYCGINFKLGGINEKNVNTIHFR